MPSIERAGEEGAGCLSAASSRTAPAREKRRAPMQPHRIGTRPGEKHFCFLLVPQKEAARAAGGSLYLLSKEKGQTSMRSGPSTSENLKTFRKHQEETQPPSVSMKFKQLALTRHQKDIATPSPMPPKSRHLLEGKKTLSCPFLHQGPRNPLPDLHRHELSS